MGKHSRRDRERESGGRGVWDRNRGWIHVESHDDLTWEGHNMAASLGPPDGWGAQVVQNEFSCEGRQAKVPGGGMPGGVRNTSGDAGHRHVHGTVVILEEGNPPLPRCPRCDLQVSRKALNGRHLETNQ